MEMLRLLATAGRYGLALTQLSEAAKLPHSTAHRLLRRLIAGRMVVQRESNKRYVLGPLAFEPGLAATQIYDLREPCRPILMRLPGEIGDTVYLTVRSGNESVCEDRYEGPSTIRVITLEVDSRRPLGLGAGGLAILSAMPEEEREHAIASIAQRHSDDQALQEHPARSRGWLPPQRLCADPQQGHARHDRRGRRDTRHARHAHCRGERDGRG